MERLLQILASSTIRTLARIWWCHEIDRYIIDHSNQSFNQLFHFIFIINGIWFGFDNAVKSNNHLSIYQIKHSINALPISLSSMIRSSPLGAGLRFDGVKKSIINQSNYLFDQSFAQIFVIKSQIDSIFGMDHQWDKWGQLIDQSSIN